MLEAKLQRVLRNLHYLVCEMGNHEGSDRVGVWYDLRLEGLLRIFIYGCAGSSLIQAGFL